MNDNFVINVFEKSSKPIIDLLDANGISWKRVNRFPLGVPIASSFFLEILGSIPYVAISSVLMSYIKSRHGRKVVITMPDRKIIQAEGITKEEMADILKRCDTVVAIDTLKPDDELPAGGTED